MTDSSYVTLSGSARTALATAEHIGAPDAADIIDFTVVLRRRAALPAELVTSAQVVSRRELAERYGASPADLALVVATLESAGAQVIEQHAGARRVRAAAPISVVQRLFGADLVTVRSAHPAGGDPFEHRMRTGELHIPAELDGVVTAVLGLDNRPQVRPHLRALDTATPDVETYTAPQLATIYDFPDATGDVQFAAILEFGGGYDPADVNTYFTNLGIPVPEITSVGVDGASNSGTSADEDSGEVTLDIEVLGAIAPRAKLAVYFAPWSDQGIADAIAAAAHADATPTVISVSWGMPEEGWTSQGLTTINDALADAAALGITVCISSGDDGSRSEDPDPGPHVSFPASSPNVLAVGGTTLYADVHSGRVDSETVWNRAGFRNASGGGVSAVFGLPDWQHAAGVPARGGRPGRGLPDVAAVADPVTGFRIYWQGQTVVIGGTSASAPLWAGLVCRFAELLQTRIGLLQPALYRNASAGTPAPGFRDITDGTNGLYPAGAGWDACTGLGVPQGKALLEVVREYLIHYAD